MLTWFVIDWRYNSAMPEDQLSHLDQTGKAAMVDVGGKPETARLAVAAGEIWMEPATLDMVQQGNLKKGDVFGVAQLAGVMAAKKTSELIPLCHALPLDQVVVELVVDPAIPGIRITARARTTAKTGVEMEALTAVAVAALTVYDMAKAVQKTMRIQNIRLIEKRGGQSGDVLNE